MDIITIILLVVILAILGFSFIKKGSLPENINNTKLIQENAQLGAVLSQKDQKIGELTKDLQNEKTERDQLSGKTEQLFVEITSLKVEKDNIYSEKEKLIKEVSNFKAAEEQKIKEFDDKIQKLDASKNALDDEKKRIRKEDEDEAEQEKANRDRMWAEHEEKVKSNLSELCKLPQYNFQSYDNKNLPEGFGGKFKPDFMIDFLGQYVIFDAKVSKSESLQSYVSNNVKTTAEKINNDLRIYPMVFFVVPTESITSLVKTHFQEQGYDFFIISPEAIPMLLSAFKKISAYELAEQLDPRDRENIVNLIAEFDYHINMRNALDLLASESGVSVLKKVAALKDDIKKEIILKKGKMRLQQFAPTDIKTLMVGTEVQQEKIEELISPKVAIPESSLKSVEPILGKRTKEINKSPTLDE